MTDEEKNDGNGDEKKKGSKKLLVVGLAGGLIVGGAATFGITTFFFAPHDTGVEEQEPEPEPEPDPEVPAIFVHITRLPASLLDADGKLVGYLFLDLTLEVETSDDRDWVNTRMPLVRDAFYRSISHDGVMTPHSLTELDYEGLPGRLRAAANNALQRDVITNILITNALRTAK